MRAVNPIVYSDDQVDQYLSHIGFPRTSHPKDQIELLTELQKRQLERVPFENLALHYSTHRRLSLGLDDLFQKIVVSGRGGYCLENNNFFGAVLRSLGFDCIYAAGRVKQPRVGHSDGGWIGWSHLINLVMVDGQRYLVDVGHGTPGPTRPILLQPDHIEDGILPQQYRIEFKNLPHHTDPNQRLWVYSHRRSCDRPWAEAYCFTETECFPTDFEAMNLYPMTSPNSIFTRNVLAQRFLMDDSTLELIGYVSLFGNRIKINMRGSEDVEQIFHDEKERVDAIERWFRIRLETEEQEAIHRNGSVFQI